MSTSQPVHPPWFDPRMPRREDCVLKAILDDRAARVPERRIALFEDGTEWTWGGCRGRVGDRGASLEHTINACQAKLVLAHPALVERLEGLSLRHIERVITDGADALEGD